eukprot:TRINITY_DN13034_c0_g1_i1.p1 TRINITY_DN13034_c0_g1~~TRINITY_DN13034_c0_g1_i1.p1  ORF type:complete len:180 (-),score=37.28 TRINITY_DN13034_c0_g1_i1:77-616(-)
MSLNQNVDSSADGKAKFWEFMNNFTEVMLITNSTDGRQHARPMRVIKCIQSEGIYFFTNKESTKVWELKEDSHVTLTGQKSDLWLYTTGRARIITDKAKLDQLWTEGVKPWFPDRTQDPDCSLICVVPEVGEYWNQTGVTNKMAFYWETAKAYVTGEKAETHGGGSDNWRRVQLNAKSQ